MLLPSEVLTRRVQHFTRGIMLGSRAFVERWFEGDRNFVKGRSRAGRKRGSKSLGNAALRGMYTLRTPGDKKPEMHQPGDLAAGPFLRAVRSRCSVQNFSVATARGGPGRLKNPSKNEPAAAFKNPP